MSICKGKPDMLPPLDAIGLKPSDQSFPMPVVVLVTIDKALALSLLPASPPLDYPPSGQTSVDFSQTGVPEAPPQGKQVILQPQSKPTVEEPSCAPIIDFITSFLNASWSWHLIFSFYTSFLICIHLFFVHMFVIMFCAALPYMYIAHSLAKHPFSKLSCTSPIFDLPFVVKSSATASFLL